MQAVIGAGDVRHLAQVIDRALMSSGATPSPTSGPQVAVIGHMTGRYLKRGVGSGYLRDFVHSVSQQTKKAGAVQSCLAAVQGLASRPPAPFPHTNGSPDDASTGRGLAADPSVTCAGFLSKRGRKKWRVSGSRRWKQHYFVLEGGTAERPPRLWYAASPDARKEQGEVNLARCTASAGGSGPRVQFTDEEHEEHENCFEMREGAKGRRWVFRCESAMEREVWLKAINEALGRLET